jgi:hypothetical protein
MATPEETLRELLEAHSNGDYARMEQIKAGLSQEEREQVAGAALAELTERFLRRVAGG